MSNDTEEPGLSGMALAALVGQILSALTVPKLRTQILKLSRENVKQQKSVLLGLVDIIAVLTVLLLSTHVKEQHVLIKEILKGFPESLTNEDLLSRLKGPSVAFDENSLSQIFGSRLLKIPETEI